MNRHTPQYIKWRRKVYQRDGHKCQYPGCRNRGRIYAHHIMKWADYPHLRFEVSNGITLCYEHHNKVKDDEDLYIQLFLGVLNQKLVEKLRKINGNGSN